MSLLSGIVKLFAKNINKKENKEVSASVNSSVIEFPYNGLKNGDLINIKLFGKEKQVEVICTGDNQFDKNGNYKKDGFLFTEKEIDLLKWLVSEINIEDYSDDIKKYCIVLYQDMSMESDEDFSFDISEEIDITSIAINVSDISESNDGLVYPEISFYGSCLCDFDNGICIGFRDKKFIGVRGQDWTL